MLTTSARPGLVKQELESSSGQDAAHVRKAVKYVCRSREELLRTNPSIKDGLTHDKERKWRRQYVRLISDAGIQLRVPQWGIAVAVTLCHRFFAVKSMKRNDRFVIATACLFLAAKVEESPKPLRLVVLESARVRFARNSDEMRKLDDPAHVEVLREECLMAERAVLYTLGFDLNIQHPYKALLGKLSKLNVLGANVDPKYSFVAQNAWNLVNDSLRSTLCLQYEAEKIAHTALYIAMQVCRMQGKSVPPVPTVEDAQKRRAPDTSPEAQDFFLWCQVKPAEVAEIALQMFEEYEDVKAKVKLLEALPVPAHVPGALPHAHNSSVAASASPSPNSNGSAAPPAPPAGAVPVTNGGAMAASIGSSPQMHLHGAEHAGPLIPAQVLLGAALAAGVPAGYAIAPVPPLMPGVGNAAMASVPAPGFAAFPPQ